MAWAIWVVEAELEAIDLLLEKVFQLLEEPQLPSLLVVEELQFHVLHHLIVAQVIQVWLLFLELLLLLVVEVEVLVLERLRLQAV